MFSKSIPLHKQESDNLKSVINPKEWSNSVRRLTAASVGLFAFLEPFASSMIAPSLQLISAEFKVTSSIERNLILSAFVLAYAFGALLLAPISETAGRRPVMLSSAGVFLAFTIGCGFAQSSAQLIVFRFFAGLGGCVPLAIGAAIIGDMYAPEDRGSAMVIYQALQMAGPAMGPIVGGWIAEELGSWRWTFYVCAIATAVVIAIGFLFLPETYAPRINQECKASSMQSFRTLDRPFVLLFTQPIIQVFALYVAVIFGVYYLFLTTIVTVFQDNYDQSVGIASLHYLALLLGLLVGTLPSGRAMDLLYKRLSAYYCKNGAPFPEARLPFLAASGTFLPAGLLLYGWAARYTLFWLVPDIGLFLIGVGFLAPLVATQHYILDCYSSRGVAASALAAMNVARFLAGFGFPLFADAMFDTLGLGWGNSVLALIAALTGCASVSLWKFGPRLRAASDFIDV